jgi:hypothetical protein
MSQRSRTPSSNNPPQKVAKYSQSMVSAGFMRSQISEVIPEENTISMNETDQTLQNTIAQSDAGGSMVLKSIDK